MYNLVVKALGVDFFKPVCNQFDEENIDYTITFDHVLRDKAHAAYAKKTINDITSEHWLCYGYNENRLAVSQLADSYFPQDEHGCACNIVFPHALVKYNPFKKGYVDSFIEYLNDFGLDEPHQKSIMDYFGKPKIFSTLTVPIESPLHYGKYKEILQQNRIQGAVCYGKNMKTTAYSGYAQTAKQDVYYIYGIGQFAPIIEQMAAIYFNNVSPIKINNLPKYSFCIPFNEVVSGHIFGFDEILIRSGVKLIGAKVI